MGEIGLGLTVLSLAIWVGLLCFRGQFWRADQRLEEQVTELELWPSVCAVIPARNEADLLPTTLRSLLIQDYPGCFTVILVDDHSTDQTASMACNVAQELNKTQQLHILSADSLPSGWTGKLWALHQGIQSADKQSPSDYFLLTDADIVHESTNLRRLVAKAEQENLDLVSLMVLLRCKSFWERLLIPAFVFFFQKLYPFRWVNDPTHSTAAAAGGCILIRPEALTRIGGVQVVRKALIDDCALAHAVKFSRTPQLPLQKEASSQLLTPLFTGGKKGCKGSCSSEGRIWLGPSSSTHSLRPYSSLATIWEMVARTAFTQLNYSFWLLLGTIIAMLLIYGVPPVGAIFGVLSGNWSMAIVAMIIWLLMTCAYLPTIKFYGRSPWLAFWLPAIALLYTLMTLDSALRHWQKRGGTWKGRVYSKTLGKGE